MEYYTTILFWVKHRTYMLTKVPCQS